MGKKCSNCAWYCHADGRCYGSGPAHRCGAPFAVQMDPRREGCGKWEFDGLEDWERADALMTMEEA